MVNKMQLSLAATLCLAAQKNHPRLTGRSPQKQAALGSKAYIFHQSQEPLEHLMQQQQQYSGVDRLLLSRCFCLRENR